jgi:predicted GIY-YIG superfamily endonuclease
MEQPTPTTLYRLYDSAGTLLYVGIAGNPGRRFEQHRKDKPWWGEVAEIKVAHYPTRAEAAHAETAAIKTERPRHNIIHNNGRPAYEPPSVATGEWSFRNRAYPDNWRTMPLELQWEIDYTSYSHDEGITDPHEAFEEWARLILGSPRAINENGCVSISWFVRGKGVFEGAPFRRPRPEWGDFFTHFTWPVDLTRRVDLNFFELPLHAGKSWYIEPASGFRPSHFQQEVHFDTLLQCYWRVHA